MSSYQKNVGRTGSIAANPKISDRSEPGDRAGEAVTPAAGGDPGAEPVLIGTEGLEARNDVLDRPRRVGPVGRDSVVDIRDAADDAVAKGADGGSVGGDL